MAQAEQQLVDGVTDAELVERIGGCQTATNRAQAQQVDWVRILYQRNLAGWVQDEQADRENGSWSLARPDPHTLALRDTESEVAAVLAWSPAKARRLVDLAAWFDQYPALAQACRSGRLETSKAAILGSGVQVLADEDKRQQVIDELTPSAHARTHRQLQNDVARAVIAADPAAAKERARQRIRERFVELVPDAVDGAADLVLHGLEPDQAVAAYNRINDTAKALKRAGDPRLLDQLRTDIAVAWLTGQPLAAPHGFDGCPDPDCPQNHHPHPDTPDADTSDPGTAGTGVVDGVPDGAPGGAPGVSGRIQLTANLFEILAFTRICRQHGIHPSGVGDTALPAELAGFAPISDWLAQRIVHHQLDNPHTVFEVLVTHPVTGQVIGVHKMSARDAQGALRTAVEAMWRTCTAPGCPCPAGRCDCEHAQDYANGGATDQANLHPVCGYHHGLKTFGGWKARRTDTGQIIWTSPAGIDYPTTPPAHTRPTTPIPDQPPF